MSDERKSWTDELDRDAYQAWWEAAGRDDVTICPCGEPAEDIVMMSGTLRLTETGRIPAGLGLCPRHRFDMSGGSRERFARAILDGTYSEAPPATEEELRRARLVADGFLGTDRPN